MLLAAWRDLQWRKKRFAITVVGTSLVFAMTLVLSGLSASFRAETVRFIDHLGADAFVASDQATGPFAGSLPIPTSDVAAVAATPGVEKASPMVFMQAPIKDGEVPQVNLIGVEAGGVGAPTPTKGRALEGSGEVVVATKLGKHPGDSINFGGRTFTVAGTLDTTVIAGIPNVFMPIGDVQSLEFAGQPLATVIVVEGVPSSTPAGFAVFTKSAAVSNLVAPLKDAQGAIQFISILLWIVAGCVIGSIIYLSAMERTRDFAVFKATGVSNGALLLGLAAQAAVLSLASALLGLGIALLLAPNFPMNIELTTSTIVLLPIIAVGVGLIASLAGMRRVMTVDPAAAFGGP